jgi:hypothetical protein
VRVLRALRAAVVAAGAAATVRRGWRSAHGSCGRCRPDSSTRRRTPACGSLDRHGVLLRSTRAEDGTRGRWMPIDRIDRI